MQKLTQIEKKYFIRLLKSPIFYVVKVLVLCWQFLSTVIPYHPQQGTPNSEQLQIYIKSRCYHSIFFEIQILRWNIKK